MTKIRNQRIWSEDQEYLKGLAEDYAFLGRRYRLEPGLLTVFALPPRGRKKAKTKTERSKNTESHASRPRKVDSEG